MKKIKDLGEKEVILCTTIEECEAIAELLDKEGRIWDDGKSYLTYKPWQDYNVLPLCFYVIGNTFDELYFFADCNYTIHNAKDFIQESTKQVSNEVKEELQDILREWTELRFQKGLNLILRERL